MNTLKGLNKKNGELNVYFSARWCLPCMKHLKNVSDRLNRITGFRGLNYVVLDQLSFNSKKRNRLELIGFDSSGIFLIPDRYYTESYIRIDPSRRVLTRFLKDLRQNFPVDINGVSFWFNSMFKVSPAGEIKYYASGR